MAETVNYFSPQSKTQRAEILHLLIDAHGWVPLPEILALGIAQYGARILELRRLGFVIENRTERVDGVRRSWFRLLNSPAPRPEPSEWKDRKPVTGLPLFDSAVGQ